MSGLPFVATAATPQSAEAYVASLDKRVLALEREYTGEARGAFSRFAVGTASVRPAVPDGATVYVVDENAWYQRTAGAWVLFVP